MASQIDVAQNARAIIPANLSKDLVAIRNPLGLPQNAALESSTSLRLLASLRFQAVSHCLKALTLVTSWHYSLEAADPDCFYGVNFQEKTSSAYNVDGWVYEFPGNHSMIHNAELLGWAFCIPGFHPCWLVQEDKTAEKTSIVFSKTMGFLFLRESTTCFILHRLLCKFE
ncbi:uncharacterized protein LOC129321919 [Prosopis cineraria]|uniref:uncharacterized protein LOC129321919 n=1 Tax=Prosopis cineraria TaxID=364024 RepID=UPI00240FF1BC|nr:uncharacterized protein LOC129321919 [Prosopis cineraria]